MTHTPQTDPSGCGHGGRSNRTWISVVLGLIALALLWGEHGAYILNAIPYLILLACPLMHLLHSRRHRHGGAR